jgi:hypothetical protein
MVDAGLVNRILTTNFDPVIVDALAITGQPIRTFDLNTTGRFQPGTLDPGSVIYLHGQVHSLFLANAPGETAQVSGLYPGVLQEAVHDSFLIVVGYSGECDPVLGALTQLLSFPLGLYWSHFSPAGDPPVEDVSRLFQQHASETYLVQDLDADTFMRKLVLDGLKLSLPKVVATPFEAGMDILSRITPYPAADQPGASDPVPAAISLLRTAMQGTRAAATPPEPAPAAGPPTPGVEDRLAEEQVIVEIRMAGLTSDVEKLEALRSRFGTTASEPVRKALGTACLRVADTAWGKGELTEAARLVDLAESQGVEPGMEAWLAVAFGNVLSDQAKLKGNTPEADRLFDLAGQKYGEALRIKPDTHEAFNNWGTALFEQAKFKGNTPEADRLFDLAGQKYAEAVRIKPDKHEAFNNWGTALSDQAKLKGNTPEADRLWDAADEKYALALRTKPDHVSALYNRACLWALRGRGQRCLEHLQRWKSCEPQARKGKLDHDPDFDLVRDLPEFRAFRDSLPD